MSYTEFCCRSGGSNLNAGTRTGSSAEPGTSADFTYASGSWVASTGVFTVASGNPQSDGVAVGDWVSVYADGSTVTGFIAPVSARTTTTITVDLTKKSGTAPTDGSLNRTLKVGGAWKGPNGTEVFPFAFLTYLSRNSGTMAGRINLKNDQTYSLTVAFNHNSNHPYGSVEGYTTAYGDDGVATFDFGTTANIGARFDVSVKLRSLKFISSATTGTGEGLVLNASYGMTIERIQVYGFRGNGVRCGSTHITAHQVEIDNCGAAGGTIFGWYQTGGHFVGSDITIRGPYTGGLLYSHSSAGAMVFNGRFIGTGSKTALGHNGQGVFVNCDFYNLAKAFTNYYPYGTIAINCNFGKCTTICETVNYSFFTLKNCGFGGGTYAYTNLGLNSGTALNVELYNRYDYAASPWVDEVNGNYNRSEAAANTNGYAGAYDPLAILGTAPSGTLPIGSYSASGGGGLRVPFGLLGGFEE